MADVTVTAANVVAGNVTLSKGTAGETITQGQVLYKKAADSKLYKADADAGSAESTVVGIAVTAGVLDETIHYQTSGTIDIGGTVTKGLIYVLSGTAGGVAPSADLAAGDYTSILGVASSATNIDISINNTGILQ